MSLLKRRSYNSLVQMKIKLLTQISQPSSPLPTPNEPEISPILSELQGKKNRVKRFSDIFESKPWLSKFGSPNWWLEEGMYVQDCEISTTEFMGKMKSSTPKTRKVERKISIDDFIKIEENYVLNMASFISALNRKLDEAIGFTTIRIREHKSSLFGNIFRIAQLHSQEILPKLRQIKKNKGKCSDLVRYFLELFKENKFYCYVNYKLLEPIIMKCKCQLFRPTEYVCFNIFGIFDEYIDFLSIKFDDAHDDGVKELVEHEKLEKILVNFLGLVYDAKQLTMIQQIEKVSLDSLFRLYQWRKLYVKPKECKKIAILPLIPTKHVKFGLRLPIDILQLGRFIMSYERSMVSQEYSYKYLARFFVFEECVIFTNIIRHTTYGYENHYWIRDLIFSQAIDGRKIVELKNGDHSLIIDDMKIVEILKTLRSNLKLSEKREIPAIFNVADWELKELIYEETDKKDRRNSFIMK